MSYSHLERASGRVEEAVRKVQSVAFGKLLTALWGQQSQQAVHSAKESSSDIPRLGEEPAEETGGVLVETNTYPSALLNDELIDFIKNARIYEPKVKDLGKKIKRLEKDIQFANAYSIAYQEMRDDPDTTPDRTEEVHQRNEELKLQKVDAEDALRMIRLDFDLENDRLDYFRSQVISELWTVLENAGFVKKDELVGVEEAVISHQQLQNSTGEQLQVEMYPADEAEEPEPVALATPAEEELEDFQRKRVLEEADCLFHDLLHAEARYGEYQERFWDMEAEYRQSIEEGNVPSISPTQFHTSALIEKGHYSRYFQGATEAYINQAKLAFQLGALHDTEQATYDQCLGFHSSEDIIAGDACAQSLMGIPLNQIQTKLVDSWRGEALNDATSREADEIETPELDDWDARSISISSSLSILGETSFQDRIRIDFWNEVRVMSQSEREKMKTRLLLQWEAEDRARRAEAAMLDA